MRKRYRVLILAAFVAALAVPLGFALSLESSSVIAPRVSEAVVVAASAKSSSSYTVERARRRSFIPPLSDGAKLLFVGSALFGLAAAMRRAN